MVNEKIDELRHLFDTINEVFDQVIDTDYQNDIVFALNIHNDGKKIHCS